MTTPVDHRSMAGRNFTAYVAIFLAVILFAALNVALSRAPDMRIDLTADRLYTPSEATRKVLARIPEPITLTLYASQTLLDATPALRAYSPRVEELLRTYRALALGKIIFRRIDPAPFSEDAYGQQLHGFMLNAGGERGYFGLVATNSVDGFEQIPFLDPKREANLEYDLTSMIDRLSRADKPRIGIVDGLGLFGVRETGEKPKAVLDIIAKNFHVFDTRSQPAEASKFDALAVVHPHHLNEESLRMIDRLVVSGKPVILFLDPLAENSRPSPRNPSVPDVATSDAGPLLFAWGIALPEDRVVADRTMALRVTASSGRQRIVASYLPWLQVRPQNLNPNDPITQRLQLMRMSSVGALAPAPGSRLEMTPLISSTGDSMLMTRNDVTGGPNPNDLLAKFQPGGQPFVLAARFVGPVRSAYVSGLEGEARMIVVADTDLLADSHVADRNGDEISGNGAFVLNALDSLVGSADLADLRAARISSRSFTTIERMEAEAEAKYQAVERQLNERLEEAQTHLAQLQSQGPAGLVSGDQQDALARYNREIFDIRRQLRNVKAAQRERIEQLERRLKFFDILLAPLVLIAIGLVVALARRLRIRKQLKAAAIVEGVA